MTTTIAAKAISHISVVSVQVKDQDAAVAFYTERLGFEKRLDVPMGENMRWVTVAPTGSATEISLVTHEVGTALGAFTGIVLETDDIDAAFAELSDRGVQFSGSPEKHPWGGWAEFADQDGNRLGLHSS